MRWVIPAILIGSGVVASASDERHLLRLNLKKYETYSYECDAVMTTVAKYRNSTEEPQTSSTTMNMNVTLRVTDVVMGQSSLACTISELRVMQRDAPSFELSFVVDPTGRVISSTAESDDPIARLIMSTITPTELIGVPLPKEPVKIGATWSTKKDDTISVDGAAGRVYTQGTLTNTFSAIRDTFGLPCWIIESATKNVRQYGDITAEGIDLTVSGTGQQSGKSYIDVSTGMVIRQEQSMSLQSTTRPVSDELAEQATLEIATTLTIILQRRAIR
jgi:hypothetical protein